MGAINGLLMGVYAVVVMRLHKIRVEMISLSHLKKCADNYF